VGEVPRRGRHEAERTAGPRSRHRAAQKGPHADEGERTWQSDMAIGPVQLVVLGFRHPNFHGRIIEELERLRESEPFA